MKKIYIVIASADSLIFDRPYLESIEGQTYASIDNFYSQAENIDANARESLTLMELSEFTTDWNDTDDDGTYLSIEDTFISYIYIKL